MKQILFNQEMTKAILEGRKIVTRLLVKSKDLKRQYNGLYTLYSYGDCYEDCYLDDLYENGYINAPYQIGDILWVREAWNICNMDIENNLITFIYKADEKEGKSANTIAVSNELYKKYDYPMTENNSEWLPSIHMPKEAARIFLKVTDVRIKRLQDITEEQILKEGLSPYDDKCQDERWKPTYNDPDSGGDPQLKQGFEILWDSTVKKDSQKWDANPWIWVIEFERCEKPIERNKMK